MLRIGLTASLLFCACAVKTAGGLDGTEEISCRTDKDCFAGWVCTTESRCQKISRSDKVGPTIQAVQAVGPTTLVVTFDEPLAAQGAAVAESYSLSPALAVNAAAISSPDNLQVVLLTAAQRPVLYQLTVVGVTDQLGNPITSGPTNPFEFGGFGYPPDTTAPVLWTPAAHEVVHVSAPAFLGVRFVWSPRVGAESYTLQVARDPAFVDLLLDEVLTTTTYVVADLDAQETAYWRVRTDIMAPDTWASSSFEPVADTVHVFCDAAASCAPPTSEIGGDGRPAVVNPESGNLTTPFRSINRGLGFALANGISRVKVARRGSGQTAYLENLVLIGGVDILGGYAPGTGFAEASRDVTAAGRSIVTGPGVVAGGIGLGAPEIPTLVEGMAFVGDDAGSYSIALELVQCGPSLTVRDCSAIGGDASDFSKGVVVMEPVGGGPELSDLDIQGGNSVVTTGLILGGAVDVSRVHVVATTDKANGTATAVSLAGLRASVRDSRFEARAANDGFAYGVIVNSAFGGTVDGCEIFVWAGYSVMGVWLEDGWSFHLTDNQIYAGNAEFTDGIVINGYLGSSVVSPALIANNVVWTGSASGGAPHALLMTNSDHVVVAHNTFTVGTAPATELAMGMMLDNSANPVLHNNIIVLPATGDRLAVHLSFGSMPRSFQNNGIMNAVGRIYILDGTPLLSINDLDGQDVCARPLTPTCNGTTTWETTRGLGNMVLTDSLSALFVAPVGLLSDADATIAANDWRLNPSSASVAARNGGKSTALADCSTVESPGTCGCASVSAQSQCTAEGVLVDADGGARTAPVSLGAYELD